MSWYVSAAHESLEAPPRPLQSCAFRKRPETREALGPIEAIEARWFVEVLEAIEVIEAIAA